MTWGDGLVHNGAAGCVQVFCRQLIEINLLFGWINEFLLAKRILLFQWHWRQLQRQSRRLVIFSVFFLVSTEANRHSPAALCLLP